MAFGVRRVRGHKGLRARDAAHGHTAVVAVIFVWTVFIAVVHVRVDLVILVGAARLRLLLRLLQLFDLLSQFCSASTRETTKTPLSLILEPERKIQPLS